MATITIYPPTLGGCGVIVAAGAAANQDVIAAGTLVRITRVLDGNGTPGVSTASISDAGSATPKWESVPALFVEETVFNPPLVLNGLRVSQNISGARLFIYTG